MLRSIIPLLFVVSSLAAAAEVEDATSSVEARVASARLPADPLVGWVLHPEVATADRAAFVDIVRDMDRNVWIVNPTYGPGSAPFSLEEVDRMRSASPGMRVLAWIPVGEDARFLAGWPSVPSASEAAGWQLGMGSARDEAAPVAWWSESWAQRVDARVDAALAAGFDGVVLGWVDAWQRLEQVPGYAETVGFSGDARGAMAELVAGAASRARATAGDDAVVMIASSNESVLQSPALAGVVDGVVIDGLYRAPSRSQRVVDEVLAPFRERGGLVVVVEDPALEAAAERARVSASERGFSLVLSDMSRAHTGLAR